MAVPPPPPPNVPLNTSSGLALMHKWFRSLWLNLKDAVSKFVDLNFAGSNLTSLETRNHNDLQALQGGAATEYYHATLSRYTWPQTSESVAGTETLQIDAGTQVVLHGGVFTVDSTITAAGSLYVVD